MHLKRAILVVSLILLIVACGLGVFVVLTNSYGRYNGDWMGLLIAAAFYSLPALASAHLRERGIWRRAMMAAVVLCVVGFVALAGTVSAASLWNRYSWGWADLLNWALVPVISTATVWAVALPILAAISCVRLRGWARLPKIAAMGLIGLSAAGMCAWPIIELMGWGGNALGDRYLQASAVLVILVIPLILSLPILYKIQGIDREAEIVSTSLNIGIICPRCRHEQAIHTGHSRCSKCRLKFILQIEEPHCPECDYLLHNLTKPACPECGAALSDDEVVTDSVAGSG